MEFSQHLHEALDRHWGNPNSARKVAEALHGELFRMDIADGDHDDQVSEAYDLGILVGRAEGQSKEHLLEQFATYIDSKRD